MRTRACTALAISASVLLTGCGTSSDTAATTTTTTTVKPAAAMKEWREATQPAIDDVQSAMKWIGGAAQSVDLADTRAACRQLDTAVSQLRARLPSPDEEVTRNVQNTVDDYTELASDCQGLSPATTKAEFADLTALIRSGAKSMRAAIDRMDELQNGAT